MIATLDDIWVITCWVKGKKKRKIRTKKLVNTNVITRHNARSSFSPFKHIYYFRHANIVHIKNRRAYVSDLVNLVSPWSVPWWARRGTIWKFVIPGCGKIHLQAPEQLKMSLKNLSTATDIFDKSRDVVIKLQENWKQA